MAPTNAAPMSSADEDFTPRLSRKIITSETASFAPDEMPSTNGPAMGLWKKVCSRYPDTDSAPPKMSAAIMRGSRICMMILRCVRFSPPPSRICQISDAESETLPARRFQIRKTARRTNSSEKPRYVRFARLRSMFVPPLVKFQSCQHRFPGREAIHHCSFVKNRSGASAPFKTVWRSTTRSLRSSDS